VAYLAGFAAGFFALGAGAAGFFAGFTEAFFTAFLGVGLAFGNILDLVAM
jgi:hypothetical protein